MKNINYIDDSAEYATDSNADKARRSKKQAKKMKEPKKKHVYHNKRMRATHKTNLSKKDILKMIENDPDIIFIK